MKTSLYTGLAILLPIFLTVMIVSFFVNLVTTPFLNSTESLLTGMGLISPDNPLLRATTKGLIFICLIIIVLACGLLGRIFLIRALFKFGDFILHRVPFFNKVYKTCQEVVHGIFSSSSSSFSQVVLVPFPTKDTLSVGFVTKESLPITAQDSDHEEVIPVFVPGTPNPTVGFMLMFPRHEIHFVDLKIETAMKLIISCGVAMPPMKVKEQ